MKNILHILLIVVLLIGGCSEKEKAAFPVPASSEGDPMILILYEKGNQESMIIRKEVEMALNYTKIPFISGEISKFHFSVFEIPSLRAVYLVTSNTEKMSDMNLDHLFRFLAKGGRLILPTLTWDERFRYFCGIRPDADLMTNKEALGFRFITPIFPNQYSQKFRTTVMPHHQGFRQEVFKRNVQVHAVALNDSTYPVILENRIGDGSVVFCNSSVINEKLYRGLLFVLALPALEGVPYPVANTSTIFLDDFPAAMYNARFHPVDKEYGLDQVHFITRIWWPDMLRLAEKYGLQYTAMLCFNYNDRTTPPFLFDQWLSSTIDQEGKIVPASPWIAGEILKTGYELGFHGYNHISYWKRDWPKMEETVLPSLIAVRKQWHRDDLGPMPVTYVPPSNIIDSVGLRLLKKGMPEIRYMCSLYMGELDEGGNREFGPDPYEPQFYDVPRISSGYIPDDESIFLQESMYIITGIWNHFIHPDDIFFENKGVKAWFKKRNYLQLWWKNTPGKNYGLYHLFESWIRKTTDNHPLIRFRTLKSAAPEIILWRASKWKRTENEDRHFFIRKKEQAVSRKDTLYYFTYISGQNLDRLRRWLQENSLHFSEKPVLNGWFIEFSSLNDSLVLPVFRSKPDPLNLEEMILAERREMERYRAISAGVEEVFSPETFRKRLERMDPQKISANQISRICLIAEEQGVTGEIIPLLEKILLSADHWDGGVAERYIRYLQWNGLERRAEVLLSKRGQIFPGKNTVDLKEFIAEKISLPRRFYMEKWFEWQFRFSSDQEKLVMNHMRMFGDSVAYYTIRMKALQLLKERSVSDSFLVFFVRQVLWNDSLSFLIEVLENIPAERRTALRSLAADIARIYAYERKDYSTADIWSRLDPHFPVTERWDWYRIQGRYHEILTELKKMEEEKLLTDSIRWFVGEIMYQDGFVPEALTLWIPIKTKPGYAEKIRGKIEWIAKYGDEESQKMVLIHYPEWMKKETMDSLTYSFTWTSQPQMMAKYQYSNDNFHNRNQGWLWQLFTGNRKKKYTLVSIQRMELSSRFGDETFTRYPWNVTLSRGYNQPAISGEFRADVGFMYWEQHYLPVFRTEITGGSFHSLSVSGEPLQTASALKEKIYGVGMQWYGELSGRKSPWVPYLNFSLRRNNDQNILTSASLGIRYHWSGGGQSGLFLQWEIARQDATKVYTDSYPYWTPDNLWNGGSGFLYRTEMVPGFFQTEMWVRRDNLTGWYATFHYELEAYRWKYWRLTTSGFLSTSRTYRSNEIRIGITAAF